MNLEKLSLAPWRAVGHVTCTCDIGYVAFAIADRPRLGFHPDVDAVDTHPIARLLHGKEVSGAVALAITSQDDAEFIALARNAFDVMMRRGWWASFDGGLHPEKWSVHGKGSGFLRDQKMHDDPFTALVEADKWYKENIK